MTGQLADCATRSAMEGFNELLSESWTRLPGYSPVHLRPAAGWRDGGGEGGIAAPEQEQGGSRGTASWGCSECPEGCQL